MRDINVYNITVGRHHLEDLRVDGRIILKRILKKKCEDCIGFNWLRVWPSGEVL
jgi:hypothetical protein